MKNYSAVVFHMKRSGFFIGLVFGVVAMVASVPL